jgi:hypothetical protein
MAITIELTLDDFLKLNHSSKKWAGQGWEDDPDRFEPVPVDDTVKYVYKYAYWFGDCWACVVLARAFLEDRGCMYQVVLDTAGDDPGWVVLTSLK